MSDDPEFDLVTTALREQLADVARQIPALRRDLRATDLASEREHEYLARAELEFRAAEQLLAAAPSPNTNMLACAAIIHHLLTAISLMKATLSAVKGELKS